MILVLRDIETSKIDLACKPDFTIIDAYRIFNQDKRTIAGDRISKLQVQDGLREGLEWCDFQPQDIYAWFKRIDQEITGNITFLQFQDAILPFTRHYADECMRRDPSYTTITQIKKILNFDTRTQFITVWQKMLQGQRVIEILRQKVVNRL